ncbi:DNA-binding response regulator [Lentzea sp. NBRC 105346]|uniref:response regulator transcription factor n=1 Tax=Lentzea sp. NBRC 105346 TaxID=3032205 RepID=UPI0024A25560|nr:response regulator transcription factor [Lentzea sp. NBRC 105346]GLZ31033.1 DNA-binding response regulator [Lentzea sp. NBRC 105346]
MRVILAEDSALLREGLVRLLAEEGHEIVAAVGTAPELLKAIHNETDIVVTDVRMPPGNTDDGLRAALEIRQRGIPVLVLSQYVENRYAQDLMAHEGGVGYLLKDRVAQVDEFLDALERVARGGAAFDPEVVRRLLKASPLDRLTPREREVLALMAQGLTNARISEELHVSQSGAEKHINAIFDKLGLAGSTGVSRRVAAVVRYLSG